MRCQVKQEQLWLPILLKEVLLLNKVQIQLNLGRKRIQQLINFQAILIGSVMLINLIFFKGTPNKEIKINKKLNSISDDEN